MERNWNVVSDWLYSQLSYQMFITPLRLRPPRQFHPSMHRAQDWFYNNRNEVLVRTNYHHHVVHYFRAPEPNGKKVLITHGWMSCATWMSKIIQDCLKQGYDVYALDFPAHGEAKGLQITWEDAVKILRDVINHFGAFEAVIGHSFGGAMLIHTINLNGQLEDFKLQHLPKRVVMLGAPTRIRTPLYRLAKRLQLSGNAYRTLIDKIIQNAEIDPRLLRLKNLIAQDIPVEWLCVHGLDDVVIEPIEAEMFCDKVPNSHLAIMPELNHVDLLSDHRVTEVIYDFLGHR